MHRTAASLAILCCAVCSPAQSPGGHYAITLDRGKPIDVSGVTMAENGPPTPIGQRPSSATKATITTGDTSELLTTVIRSCLSGGRFSKVTLTYFTSEKKVEYTVLLKHVTVAEITFPAVDDATRTLGDFNWTLDAESAEIDYTMMHSAGGLSSANAARLERARARMEANLLEQVRHHAWEAPKVAPTVAEGDPFALHIEGLDTGGVASLAPLVLKRPFRTGKGATFQTGAFVVYVEGTRSAEFADALKRGRTFPTGSLSYFRLGDRGTLALAIKNLAVKTCSRVDEKAAKPVDAVEITYGDLAFER